MEARNQAFLRKNNKWDVIKLLRAQSRSYSDVARVLNLSNTAVGKIADELIAKGLVKRENETKGRAGITLSVNADFGYVLAVDLSGREIVICAADFKRRVLLKRVIEDAVSVQRSDLALIIGSMREMTESEELKERKLCCIAVATPGKLEDSGEFLLNPRFRGFEHVSIERELREAFGCDVVVKNDVNLAMEGEKACGTALRDVKNALMLHIDVGTGAALLFGGRVYEGSHGFAGEIGYLKLNAFSTEPESLDNLNYSNFFDSVSLFSSLSVLKREVQNGAGGALAEYAVQRGISLTELPLDALIEAYRAGDPLTRRVLDASARIIGTVAAGLAELLDVEIVLINGAVCELGGDFLSVVASYVKSRPVQYSSSRDVTMTGAIDIGLTQSFINNL